MSMIIMAMVMVMLGTVVDVLASLGPFGGSSLT